MAQTKSNGAKKPASKATKASKAAKKATKGAPFVNRWEDDPQTATNAKPIRVTPANPQNLKISIQGNAVAPAIYAMGTANFRYWNAAASLRESALFWESLLGTTRWYTGATLPIFLDEGVDLNAYYDRAGLSFFHDNIGGLTVFSGESPDVACHELGHAVLDALRPELWDAAFDEAAAFHEAFGDMSAILSNLQLPSIRKAILKETGGRLYRNSRLSRLAEQLGWAIRQFHPDAVDGDSLRNAVNSFFYRDPQALPPSAPANLLSSESHSFSRVFTAGFLEALGNMLAVQSANPREDDLQIISVDAGKLLVKAVRDAPVVPEYYSQIAAHMIQADQQSGGRYRDALKSAFVRRGILSLHSAAALTPDTLNAAAASNDYSANSPQPPRSTRNRGTAATASNEEPNTAPLGRLALSGTEFGLGNMTLHVHAQDQSRPKSFGVAGSTPGVGTLTPPAHETAAKSFVAALLRRGRVDLENHANADTRTLHQQTRKTHAIVGADDGLVLVRRHVDCGFDCSCRQL